MEDGKDGAMRAEREETELTGPFERRWDRGVRGLCSAVVVLFWWSLEVVVLAGLGLMVALVWV